MEKIKAWTRNIPISGLGVEQGDPGITSDDELKEMEGAMQVSTEEYSTQQSVQRS